MKLFKIIQLHENWCFWSINCVYEEASNVLSETTNGVKCKLWWASFYGLTLTNFLYFPPHSSLGHLDSCPLLTHHLLPVLRGHCLLVDNQPTTPKLMGETKDPLLCYPCALEGVARCSNPDSILHTRHLYLTPPSHLQTPQRAVTEAEAT